MSRLLVRLFISLLVLFFAIFIVGLTLSFQSGDSSLEQIFERIVTIIIGLQIMAIFGIALNVWSLAQPEPDTGDHTALRILSPLLIPLVGMSWGFAAFKAGFNLNWLVVTALHLVSITLLWFHCVLMLKHMGSLISRCELPCNPWPDRLLKNIHRWFLVFAVLYVLGPFRWAGNGAWTVPGEKASDLLIFFAAVAWLLVYVQYGWSCARPVERELEFITNNTDN